MAPRDSLTARALRSLAWVISSMSVLYALRLANLMILARLLGPDTFGLMSAALVVAGLSYIVADMGVGYALIQRPAVTESDFRTATTVSLVNGMLFFLVVWGISDPVGEFFDQPRLPALLKVLAIAFPLRSLSVPSDAILQRELAFATIARIDVTAYTLGYFVVSLALAYSGFEIWALAGAFLGEALVRTALLLYLSRHPFRPGLDRASLRNLLQFGTGVSLTRVANFIALQADKIVVGRMLGTVTLGAYERAYQLMVMPANMLGQVVGRVLFPAFSRIQQRPEALRSNYRRSLALTALVTLPLSAFIVILNRELVNLILGKRWDQAVPAFGILGAVLLFRASYKISGEFARACGAIYGEAWRQVAYAVAVFAGGVAGSRWGLAGVSTGVALAIGLNFALMTDLGRRLAGLSWREVAHVHRPAAIVAAIAGVTCLLGEKAARQLLLGDLLATVIGAGLGSVAGITAMVRWPRLAGEEASWLVAAVIDHSPPAVARLLSRRAKST